MADFKENVHEEKLSQFAKRAFFDVQHIKNNKTQRIENTHF